MEDRVVNTVIDAIQDQRLVPGERLIERELAEASGASRMAVRNGLLRLSKTGLVDLSRNKGATVAQCSPEDGRQIFEARIVNEEAALIQLAGRMNDEAVTTLQDILRREAAAYDDGRIEEARLLSRQFHVTFTGLSGNALIARFVKELIDCQPLVATRRGGRISTFSGVTAHTKTLAALARGDGQEAAAINTSLLRSLQREMALDQTEERTAS